MQTFLDDAAEALRVTRDAGAVLIINDRVDVALALGADGIHLGQTDLPVRAARRLLGPSAIIGYSTHNLEQVKAALDLPLDYLAFGPIFETRSKLNPDPVAGLEGLRAAKALAGELPLVAIGGIAPSNVADALAAGADSLAIISALLKEPEKLAENMSNLLTATAYQRR